MVTGLTMYPGETGQISWTCSGNFTVGQFVGGDYYLVAPSGVTILSVSPAPSGGTGSLRNGSMINPITSTQAYDSRMEQFQTGLIVNFPVVLTGGQTLVSTASLTTSDLRGGYYYPSWGTARARLEKATVKSAAVLTVLSEAPPANAFRPPFGGNDKPIYTTDQIQTNLLLGLSTTITPSEGASYYTRGLSRPWLMHIIQHRAENLHPRENMLGYHRDIGKFLSAVALLLLTDDVTDELVNAWIQTGIDFYAMITTGGEGDSAAYEWLAIFTGLLLGDENFARVYVERRNHTQGRAEEKFYLWEDRLSTYNSSHPDVIPGRTWTGATVFFRKQTTQEYEHLHPTEWSAFIDDDDNGKKGENYRLTVDSIGHLGMILASRILGKDSYWPNLAPRAYLERWMTEPFQSVWAPILHQTYSGLSVSATESMSSSFANEMWETYRDYSAVADLTPPSWTGNAPSYTNVTASGFSLRVQTNEAGVAFCVLTSGDMPFPSAVQTATGTNFASRGSGLVSSSSQSTIQITGLTPATAYKAHVIAQDNAGNLQAETSILDVTTLSLVAQTGGGYVMRPKRRGGAGYGNMGSLFLS